MGLAVVQKYFLGLGARSGCDVPFAVRKFTPKPGSTHNLHHPSKSFAHGTDRRERFWVKLYIYIYLNTLFYIYRVLAKFCRALYNI